MRLVFWALRQQLRKSILHGFSELYHPQQAARCFSSEASQGQRKSGCARGRLLRGWIIIARWRSLRLLVLFPFFAGLGAVSSTPVVRH
jgi:hypothetical protein